MGTRSPARRRPRPRRAAGRGRSSSAPSALRPGRGPAAARRAAGRRGARAAEGRIDRGRSVQESRLLDDPTGSVSRNTETAMTLTSAAASRSRARSAASPRASPDSRRGRHRPLASGPSRSTTTPHTRRADGARRWACARAREPARRRRTPRRSRRRSRCQPLEEQALRAREHVADECCEASVVDRLVDAIALRGVPASSTQGRRGSAVPADAPPGGTRDGRTRQGP